MQLRSSVIVAAATGVIAPAALADPLALPSTHDRFDATGSQDWFVRYVLDVAGPSAVAPTSGFARTATTERPTDSSLLFTMAGPSPFAPDDGTRLTIDPGAFGEGPGNSSTILTTVDRPGSLLPDLLSRPTITTVDRPGGIQPGEGTFEVAVPLPGGGALAAAGLVFVAVRRRRR
ncbi:MAG: hypothetical protein RIE77_13735 [Phycisphaerales bacterium]|jgi:hypothetical protein